MPTSPSVRLAALAAASLLACAHGPSAKERKSAEIHHDLGAEALRGGRYPEALKEFEDALAVDDRFPEAHRGRALVLDLGFGRVEDAERAYRRAIELRPDYSEAHNDLGQLLARTGRTDEAVKEFDAALSNMYYREPFVARCNKGLAVYRAGRRDEGLSLLKACVAGAPGYCRGHRDLGRVLLDERRPKEAIEEFATYVRYCDRFADAHLQLGLARMKVGDASGAREAFERCRDLGGASPEGEECRKSLSHLGAP